MFLEYQKNFLEFLNSFQVASFNPSSSGEWALFTVLCDFLYELCNQKLTFEKDIKFMKLRNNREVADYVFNSKGFDSSLEYFVDKFVEKYCLNYEKKDSKISNFTADSQSYDSSNKDEEHKKVFQRNGSIENEANKDKQSEILNEIYAKRVLRKTNPEFSSVSDALRICFSEKKGRFVESRADISSGEVLIVEKPFVSWLKPSLNQSYCHHCFKILLNTVVQCKHCSIALFCSEKCFDESWEKYHKFECKLSKAVEVLSKGHLALRIAFIVGIDEIKRVTELGEGDERSATDYEFIYSLIDHYEECSYTNFMFDVLGANFLSLLLKKLGFCNENNQIIIAKALLKHLLQINMNCIQIMDQKITDLVKNESGEVSYKIKLSDDSIGVGLYQSLSLVNHSCYNVTKSLFNGNEMCLVSNCDLVKGDEITYNYGAHYKVADRTERQKYLSDIYYFECQCKACEQDWK